jgi:tetratricopeptide (TPR) repeat protein
MQEYKQKGDLEIEEKDLNFDKGTLVSNNHNNTSNKEKTHILDYSNVFINISKVSIFILTFLLPIFFFPFNNFIYYTDINEIDIDTDFSKQALLLFLSFISLTSLLAHFMIRQKIEFKKSLTGLIFLIFFAFFAISSFFSIYKYGSLWGDLFLRSESLLTFFALLVFYFVAVNIFEKKNILILLFFLFLSGFLLSVAFFLQNILEKVGIFNFDFAKKHYFSPIGSTNYLAIFDSFLLVLILPLIFKAKGLFKASFSIFAAFFFFTLLFIYSNSFKISWLVLLAGLSFLGAVLLPFIRSKKLSIIFVVLLIFLIFSSTLFIFSSPNYNILGIKPGFVKAEPFLFEFNFSFSLLKEFNLKELLLGTGPGTFSYVWNKYKPLQVNQTDFWSLTFLRPVSEFISILIETGVLGVLSFLFLIIISFYILFSLLGYSLSGNIFAKNLNKKESGFVLVDHLMFAVILSGLFTISFILFIYPANITLWFSFFLLFSFVSILENSQREENKNIVIDFTISSTKSLIISFGIIIVFISLCGLLINYGKIYLADYFYSKGVGYFKSGDLNNTILSIEKAANLNPKFDLYFRDLSNSYILQLKDLLGKESPDPEKVISLGRLLVEKSIKAADRSTQLNVNNFYNWIKNGIIYESLIGILDGADDKAISSYKKAQELNPLNPEIPYKVGLIYLIKHDTARQQNQSESSKYLLDLAKQNFEKSIELKPNYDLANFQLATVYIIESKTDEAIQKLELLKTSYPLDPGIAFRLGVMYFNKNENEKAKSEFERVILVDPQNSNARYFLGLILDLQGKKDEAIAQFEIIERFNPDNQEIKNILKNLREGKRATESTSLSNKKLPINDNKR